VGIHLEEFASGVQVSHVSRREELICQEERHSNGVLHEMQSCKSVSGASEAPDADVVVRDVDFYAGELCALAVCTIDAYIN